MSNGTSSKSKKTDLEGRERIRILNANVAKLKRDTTRLKIEVSQLRIEKKRCEAVIKSLETELSKYRLGKVMITDV